MSRVVSKEDKFKRKRNNNLKSNSDTVTKIIRYFNHIGSTIKNFCGKNQMKRLKRVINNEMSQILLEKSTRIFLNCSCNMTLQELFFACLDSQGGYYTIILLILLDEVVVKLL
jgi:hypothetical protein